jgi:hypothetical protein
VDPVTGRRQVAHAVQVQCGEAADLRGRSGVQPRGQQPLLLGQPPCERGVDARQHRLPPTTVDLPAKRRPTHAERRQVTDVDDPAVVPPDLPGFTIHAGSLPPPGNS